MGYAIYFFIAILVLIIIGKLFSWPLKILCKLIINAVLGVILLFITNFIGGYLNIYIPINAVTALIAGFFGVPGVIFLIIFKILL